MRLGKEFFHVGYRLHESPPDGSTGGSVPADDADIDANADLDDAGKKALKAERAARRDAARQLKETQDSLKALQDQLKALNDDKAQRDAAAAEQAERDREAKGEFEQLARDREKERDQAKADLAALKKDFDALRSAATATVKVDFDALPEPVREAYTGDADDPVAILAFLPTGKKLAALIPGGEQNNTQEVEGAEKPPKPAGGGDQAKIDESAARLNMGRYQ